MIVFVLVFLLITFLLLALFWLQRKEEKYMESGVTFFQGCRYKGMSFTLDVGQYDITNPDYLKNISSIRVPSGYSATIYEYAKCTGNNATFITDVPCLADIPMFRGGDWNNKVVSVKISRVEFYSACSFGGKSVFRGEGFYNTYDMDLSTDMINSIKVPNGYGVKLYDLPSFKGNTITITTDVDCLSNISVSRGMSWKGKVKSLQVYVL